MKKRDSANELDIVFVKESPGRTDKQRSFAGSDRDAVIMALKKQLREQEVKKVCAIVQSTCTQ